MPLPAQIVSEDPPLLFMHSNPPGLNSLPSSRGGRSLLGRLGLDWALILQVARSLFHLDAERAIRRPRRSDRQMASDWRQLNGAAHQLLEGQPEPAGVGNNVMI